MEAAILGGQPSKRTHPSRVCQVSSRRGELEGLAWARFAGEKRCFRVATEDGREILTAAEHRFLTEAGWRRLEQIRPGNEILVPSRIVARQPIAAV
jgi:intein/homing endonuclease